MLGIARLLLLVSLFGPVAFPLMAPPVGAQTDQVEVWSKELSSLDKETRLKAIGKLGELQDPRAAARLARQLWLADEEARAALAKALGAQGQLGANAVLTLLREAKDSGVRQRAAEVLAAIPDPDAAAYLDAALTRRDLPVVAGAHKYYLARLSPGDEAVVEALLKALAASGTDAMAAAFTQSGQPRLAQAGQDWRRIERLIGELQGGDQAKRLEALKELKKIKDPKAARAVSFRVLDRNAAIREAAIQAVNEMGPAAAREVIMVMQRSASIATVKEAAAVLPRLHDPLAAQALQDALTSKNLPVIAGAHAYYLKRLTPGNTPTEEVLLKALGVFGDAAMAQAFSQSDNPRLARAGRDWRPRPGK